MTARPLPAWIRDHRLVAGLLFLATLVAYLPAMSGSFHFDDMHSIVLNQGVRDVSNIPRFFVEPQLWSSEPGNCMYRPVLLVTYAIDHQVWGYNAAGWLLTNALVHAAVAILVFRLALRLGLGELAAMFAGAVFALHPALSETQNYVSSRSESVAALVMLVALHVYLTARVAAGGRRIALLGASAGIGALAVLTKETTAGFCLAVLWFEAVAVRGHAGGRAARAFVALVVLAAGLGVALLVRREMLGHAVAELNLVATAPGVDAQVGGGRSVLGNLLVQSRVVVLYLQTLVRPVELNVDHDVAVRAPMAAVVAACAVHFAVAAAALRAAWRGARLFPLCVGWFWIFLAPSVVVPLNVVMNEHRLYLPMIAVALLAGASLARVAELLAARTGSFARGMAIAAAPLACFVPLVVDRSLEWRTDESLWTVAVERAPHSARAHMHLGAVWHEQANGTFERDERVRLLEKALAEYAKSDALHPGWADLQLDLGNAWFTRGEALHDPADFEKALAAYDRFADIVGAKAHRPRLLRSAALAQLGRFDESIALVEGVKDENRDDSPMYDTLIARILRKKGDKAGAAAAMERVIARTEPKNEVDGLLDLGWWYFEDGDHDRAAGYLGRAWNVANVSRDMRPPLYMARFLVLLRQPGAEKFLRDAMALGWKAPLAEARWVAGGATPGVFRGTVGAPGAAPPPR